MNKSIYIYRYLVMGIILFSGIALFGCDMCRNTIIEEVLSPDRTNKIIVFDRDCGATTGFSTQVSITNFETILANERGNLFIADTDHGKAPAGKSGGPKVEAMWRSNNSIIIKHHKDARVFKAESKIRDINIIYETY